MLDLRTDLRQCLTSIQIRLPYQGGEKMQLRLRRLMADTISHAVRQSVRLVNSYLAEACTKLILLTIKLALCQKSVRDLAEIA